MISFLIFQISTLRSAEVSSKDILLLLLGWLTSGCDYCSCCFWSSISFFFQAHTHWFCCRGDLVLPRSSSAHARTHETRLWICTTTGKEEGKGVHRLHLYVSTPARQDYIRPNSVQVSRARDNWKSDGKKIGIRGKNGVQQQQQQQYR